MKCQRCQSERVAQVSARCSDLCFYSIGDVEKDGYVPDNVGIGGGDNVEVSYCLECGQLQGEWPVPEQNVAQMRQEHLERQIDALDRRLSNDVSLSDQERQELLDERDRLEEELSNP